PGMMGGRPPGPMGGGYGDPAEMTRQRLGMLKQQLAIKPEQEESWTAYANALNEQMSGKAGMHNEMNANMPPKDPMEMEARRIEAMERMLAQKKAVFEAYKSLMAKLDDRQKALLGPAQVAPCNH
ncbi:MAG: Spy/CpxP family protein refolding chaperone, partial [Magnetococcales bacterium]|nr:Spy/CpxP family protein refolding chaperone [Magnetococcales bacterium]